jgi:hypothetical protein
MQIRYVQTADLFETVRPARPVEPEPKPEPEPEQDRPCRQCGLPLKKHLRAFCNAQCMKQYREAHAAPDRPCRHCGKTLYRHRRSFCSMECMNQKRKEPKPKRRRKPVPAGERLCRWCNGPLKDGGFYCSKACSGAAAHARVEANDPSPEEIREICREIQSEWNSVTERQRRGAPEDEPVMPQIVSLRGID